MNRFRFGRTPAIWANTFAVTLLLATAAVATAEEPTVLRGHVLLPDGKPAAGAELYWLHFNVPQPKVPGDVAYEKRAVTDETGRFELSLKEGDAPLGPVPRPLFAYKPGYGVEWTAIDSDAVPPDIALRLVEDHPIRGRVTNTEGQPVVGGKVVVSGVHAASKGGLDDFLTAWAKNPRQAQFTQSTLDRQFYFMHPIGPALATVTGKDGRFELWGVGIERLAMVHISAPGIVSEVFRVVNRENFDAASLNKARQANAMPQMPIGNMLRLTGPVFDHVAEMELVVRGTVFTGPGHTPVVGATVQSSGGANNSVYGRSDEAGHFELRGLRRSQNAALMVGVPPGDTFLPRSVRLDLALGQTVIDVDVELTKGVVVEGRVFDRTTGRGVKSSVHFVPLPGNQYVDQADNPRGARMAPPPTDDDGHFRVLVMPGLGVLMAQVRGGRPLIEGNKPIPYRQASFSEEDSNRVKVIVEGEQRRFTTAGELPQPLMVEHAVKVIDLAPDGAPATCDLPLDPGKTVTIAIEDEQASPVADVIVGGVADTWPIAFKNAEPTCTIYGLGADRPRHVCVMQPERHLSGSMTLTGDEPGPVKVRLLAAASISGRALDPSGEPMADALVESYYRRGSAWEVVRLAERDQAPLKTDADGRFRMENVLPGERLSIQFKQGDKYFGGPQITSEKRQLSPGEQLDLGDFKVKRS